MPEKMSYRRFRCHLHRLIRVTVLVAAVLAMIVGGAADSDTDTFTILQFSDPHINPNYTSTSPADDFGKFGQDPPFSILNSTLTAAKSLIEHPDLVLFSGDSVFHHGGPSVYSLDQALATVSDVHKQIETFYPGVRKSSTLIGNSDSVPDYYLDHVRADASSVNPFFSRFAQVFKRELESDKNYEQFVHAGYTKTELFDGLWLISLNTVMYSPSHYPNTSAISDPFGQFRWLNATLASLRARGDRALVAGHIPPVLGSFAHASQWHPHYVMQYKALMQAFEPQVVGQVFGHLHRYEFRVPIMNMKEEEGDPPLPPLFIIGSISPIFDNNPSFILWKMHKESKTLLDMEVHYASLPHKDEGTDKDSGLVQEMHWKKLFTASSAYGVTSLSREQMIGLYDRINTETDVYREFEHNFMTDSPMSPHCTNFHCKIVTKCTMQWFVKPDQYYRCVYQEELIASQSKRLFRPTWPIITTVIIFSLLAVLATVYFVRVQRSRRDYAPVTDSIHRTNIQPKIAKREAAGASEVV